MPTRQTTVRQARREAPSPDRPRLVGAGLQHAEPPPEDLKVNIPYRGSQGPLHLLIDSTGIKAEGEGCVGIVAQPGPRKPVARNARKHGGSKRVRRRLTWRKIHLGIDERSLETKAVEFTSSDIGDAPMLPELLDRFPPDQDISSGEPANADGAYDTRKCHDAIAERGAHAVIPPRKNAKPWKADTAGAVAGNEALRASRRFGRTIWRRWSGYHRRSRAETEMHCVKLPGQRLTARELDRPLAEFQVRVAVMNGFTVLGIPLTEVAG